MSSKKGTKLMEKDIKSVLAEVFVVVLAGESLIQIAQAVANLIDKEIWPPEAEWLLLIICLCILFRWAFGGGIQLLREDLSFLEWLRDIIFIGLEFFLILLFPMILEWLKNNNWKAFLILFLFIDVIWVLVIGIRKTISIIRENESLKFLYQKIPSGWLGINGILMLIIFFIPNLEWITVCFIISLFVDLYYTYYVFYKAEI